MQISKMEEEIANEWQAKCDKMVAAANDKHARQITTLKDELEEAQSKVATLEGKVS
jgi:flagellar biosynthesis chaperone FliJ